jgi:hypothetical protein
MVKFTPVSSYLMKTNTTSAIMMVAVLSAGLTLLGAANFVHAFDYSKAASMSSNATSSNATSSAASNMTNATGSALNATNANATGNVTTP